MDNSVVLGWGTVGQATAQSFGIKNYYSRSSKTVELTDILKFEYVFICLPTPVSAIGYYDTSAIETVLDEVFKNGSQGESIFIIRSTVYPGFNKKLQEKYKYLKFVSNPEFLSEDTAIEDANHPDFVIVGSEDLDARAKVVALYRGRFKSFSLVETDSVTAEMIKLSLNSFFAMKVVFANEIYDYAEKVGAKYHLIQEMFEKHRWGSKNHFTVIHKGGRGAGGKCLNKDIEAMSHHSESPLFRSVDTINKELLAISKK